MRKNNNIINTAVAVIAVAVLAVGCISEKYEHGGLRNVIIQLDVATDELLTRSELAESEQTVGTLRIYAFRGEKLCGFYHQSDAYAGPILMDLELPDGESEVDFYLIANEEEMGYHNDVVVFTEDMTREQLENVRFTSLIHRNSLPMYCVQKEIIDVSAYTVDANVPEGHQSHLKLVQQVNFILSRSLAKLSVYAAKASGAAADPQILSVSLLSGGTREYSYLFPQDEQVLDAIPSQSNDRQFLSSDVTVTKELQSGSSESADPDNYTPVTTDLYLPEVSSGYRTDEAAYSWETPSGDADAAVLRVEYSLGEGQELRNRYVYLPRIERNQHIKVCMLINAAGQLMVNYLVADWDWDEDKMLDWFFDYPTHTYIWHMVPEIEPDLHKKPESPAVMSETKPFVGYFQMTYPDSDRWTPTLEGLHASNCSIKVFNEETGDEVFSSDSPVPLEVSEDWHRIEVYPEYGQMNEGDSVNLAITYTPSGFTESEYLLINGSHPDYFWPGSTSENYITITMVN